MIVETKERNTTQTLADLKAGTVFKRPEYSNRYMTLIDDDVDDMTDLIPCVDIETGELRKLHGTIIVLIVKGKFVEE